MIGPAINYGANCWPIRKQYMQIMSVEKMRMSRWMCGKTKKSRIINEHTLKHLGVRSIGSKLIRTGSFEMIWICPSKQRCCKKFFFLQVDDSLRKRGRPKRT